MKEHLLNMTPFQMNIPQGGIYFDNIKEELLLGIYFLKTLQG